MKEQVLNQEFEFYYNMLSKGQKESLILMMKSFLNKSAEKSKPISIAQYNKELEGAENRINEGKFITHQSLKDEAKNW